jgi:hypothetical protein
MTNSNNNRPEPEPLNATRVSVEARTLPDGSCVFPVPSRMPVAARLVFGHGAAHDHTHLLDMALTFPREEVEAYAAFLARHGAIDREPTGNEIDTMLQLVGNHLVETQIEIMANLSEFMIERLGSGNKDEARAAATDSIAAAIAADALKAGAVPAEEANEAREAIAEAIRKWAERMANGGSTPAQEDGHE